MGLTNRVRPSPAMIVAALALVVALAGTAIAAPDIATRAVTKSKVKKIAKKQAKKQIRKKAPGLSVNHANTADSATDADHAFEADHANTANSATNATNAQNASTANTANSANTANTANTANRATNANTIAYGMFEADGTISAANRVKNLSNANVTHPAAGTYCFEGLSFEALSAMTTGDSGFGFNDTLTSVRIATPTGGVLAPCPAAASVRVRTYDVSDGSLQDRRFLIWFQD